MFFGWCADQRCAGRQHSVHDILDHIFCRYWSHMQSLDVGPGGEQYSLEDSEAEHIEQGIAKVWVGCYMGGLSFV
jgi:hypothetical protein